MERPRQRTAFPTPATALRCQRPSPHVITNMGKRPHSRGGRRMSSPTASLTTAQRRILRAFRFRNRINESELMHRLADARNLDKDTERLIEKGFLTMHHQNGGIAYHATEKLQAVFVRQK